MKKFIFIFFIISLLLAPGKSEGQRTSFLQFYKAGIEAYNQLDFETAINQFEAAKITRGRPDTVSIAKIDDWINKSQNGFIDAIKKARDEALAARDAEAKARKIAQANQWLLLSNNERSDQKDTNAIILAYSGKSLAANLPVDNMETSFGQAAYNYLKKEIQASHLPIRNIYSNSFSNKILVEGAKGQLMVLDTEGLMGDNKPQFNSLAAHQSYINQVGLHAGSGLTYSAGADAQVKVWNKDAQQVSALNGHEGAVLFCTVSKNGKLITGDNRGKAIVWDAQGQQQYSMDHGAPVYEAYLLSDGRAITRAGDRKIRIWNNQGQIESSLSSSSNAYFKSLAVDESAGRIVALNIKGVLAIWDLKGQLIKGLQNDRIKDFQLSTKGAIYALSSSNQVKVYDLEGRAEKLISIPGMQDIDYFRFFDEADALFASTASGTSWLVNAEGEKIALSGTNPVLNIETNPEGKLFLITYQNGSIRLWDNKGALHYQEEQIAYDWKAIPARFSQDGQFIISVSGDKSRLICAPVPAKAWTFLQKHIPELQEEIKAVEQKHKIDIKAALDQ